MSKNSISKKSKWQKQNLDIFNIQTLCIFKFIY